MFCFVVVVGIVLLGYSGVESEVVSCVCWPDDFGVVQQRDSVALVGCEGMMVVLPYVTHLPVL